MSEKVLEDRLAGVLLGTAVGDAIGLPFENISPRRLKKLFPGPLRHHLFFGRGMISDDTEQTLFVGQSLLANARNVELFQRDLGGRLRNWFLALPAGLGKATLRSCLKLCVGWPPARSGVWSAGNGAAMRSALIGAYFYDQPEELENFVRAASVITHRDPRATVGALAVAHAAARGVREAMATRDMSAGDSPDGLLAAWAAIASDDSEWQQAIETIRTGLIGRSSVMEFAAELGLGRGVSGYVYHTVPVALYAALRHRGSYSDTIEAVMACGGDTDTVGAIAGAIAGSMCGREGIPGEWIESIWDWPRSTRVLREVARRLARQKLDTEAQTPVSYFWPAVFPRNLFFLAIVLLHGFRRLAPPY